MPTTLNLATILRDEAATLRRAREEAIRLHPGNIRAAGNHVEEAVREYLRRMLYPRYHVTGGHLIDAQKRVSPQLDIIISDNFGLPSLLTVRDGTEYVPITSVYAIREVKSTYYQSKVYLAKMNDVLREISLMGRPLIENTNHGGPHDNTLLEHMVLSNKNKYLNNLFSFMLCMDSGDFSFEHERPLRKSVDPGTLPSMSVLLNTGVVSYARVDPIQGLKFHKYPHEASPGEFDWCYYSGVSPEHGSLEGCHLSNLYGALVEHLADSRLEPPDAYRYTKEMAFVSRSSLLWAKATPE